MTRLSIEEIAAAAEIQPATILRAIREMRIGFRKKWRGVTLVFHGPEDAPEVEFASLPPEIRERIVERDQIEMPPPIGGGDQNNSH